MARLAAVVLGVVLAFAGGAKLASPTWPRQADELGAPRVVALLVPWLELALGAALLVGLGLPWAAWAAGGLLVAFTSLLALRLSQGVRPPCACFGGRTPRPIGPLSIVRNVALIALALAAALA